MSVDGKGHVVNLPRSTHRWGLLPTAGQVFGGRKRRWTGTRAWPVVICGALPRVVPDEAEFDVSLFDVSGHLDALTVSGLATLRGHRKLTVVGGVDAADQPAEFAITLAAAGLPVVGHVGRWGDPARPARSAVCRSTRHLPQTIGPSRWP